MAKNKISISDIKRPYRTPVINTMAEVLRKAGSEPLEQRAEKVEKVLQAFSKWNPGDWDASEEEIQFVLNVRKQYPTIWKKVSGFNAEDWDDDQPREKYYEDTDE